MGNRRSRPRGVTDDA